MKSDQQVRRTGARRDDSPEPGHPLLRRRIAHRPAQSERDGRWPRPLGYHPPRGHHRRPAARGRPNPARGPGRNPPGPAERAPDHQQPVRRLGARRRARDRVSPMAALHRLQPALPGRVRSVEARDQHVPARPDPVLPPQLRQSPQGRRRLSRPGSSPAARTATSTTFPGCASPTTASRLARIRSSRSTTSAPVDVPPTCWSSASRAEPSRPWPRPSAPPLRGSCPNAEDAIPTSGWPANPAPSNSAPWFSVRRTSGSTAASPSSRSPSAEARSASSSTTTGPRSPRCPSRKSSSTPSRSDRTLQAAFAGYDADDIWAAIEAHRAGAKPVPDADVLGPEWAALTAGSQGQTSPHFEAEPIAAPTEFAGKVAGVTLAHRLRVVTALCGFTRISAGEPGDGRATARLETTGSPTWVPVVENRGEGIFLRLDENAVQAWEAKAWENPLFVEMRRAHRDWRQARGLDPSEGWPGERFVLLHSLSHALINELAIECGYSSASISERIYSRGPGDGPEPMAGILLYTSAPDAEGTLGGLVHLGQASELGPILRWALERSGLCSSDPLCADHQPDAATSASTAPPATRVCSSQKPAASEATATSTDHCSSTPSATPVWGFSVERTRRSRSPSAAELTGRGPRPGTRRMPTAPPASSRRRRPPGRSRPCPRPTMTR